MNDGDKCTRDDAVNFMARQGLVYSGLDKHFDDWFEEYRMEYGFECVGDDSYIYHED